MAKPERILKYKEWWAKHAPSSVEYGFCWCGCEQRTALSSHDRPTHHKNYMIRGEPQKYIIGHRARGTKHTEEWRHKMSVYFSGERNPFRGKKHSKETRDRLSQIIKNNFRSGKVKHPMLGKHLSAEAKNIISQKLKGRFVGSKNPFYGKTHSPEVRQILSKANKGKIISLERRQKQSQLMAHSGNPNWQGGISEDPYPAEWTKMLKEQVRNRDNYRCVHCGLSTKEQGCAMHVHHVDGNKQNCVLSNLISLCCRCHMRLHRSLPIRKRTATTNV